MLLLMDEFLGKDRWWISLNLLGVFFGIIFRGEIWKGDIGGDRKGLVSLWVFNFFLILVLIIDGFFKVDNKFLVDDEICFFLKCKGNF